MTTTTEIEKAIPSTPGVDPHDAALALVYTDGILDYDRHDAILRSCGYEYLALPCNCAGSDDDGHLPSCGWGRAQKTIRTDYLGAHIALFGCWSQVYDGMRWWDRLIPFTPQSRAFSKLDRAMTLVFRQYKAQRDENGGAK